MATQPPILADHSRYSRKFLGDAVFGETYVRDCAMIRQGSADLLKAIERTGRTHPGVRP